jgi:hypothetical protein
MIGLVGRARVGKDTVADLFKSTHTVCRFAQPMKNAIKALYGWSDEMIETNLKDVVDPVWGLTPRTAMIHMAETTKKLVGGEFFVKRLFEEWDGNPIIIADVRYENEVRAIHARGGITIKITREGIHKHESESNIDALETTYQITNNGSLDSLRRQVDGLGLA